MALGEVKPAFGVNEEDLNLNFLTELSSTIARYILLRKVEILHRGSQELGHRKTYQCFITWRTWQLVNLLVQVHVGLGNRNSRLSKMLSGSLVGMSEGAKIATIDNIFRDVYKSPLNVLVIDKIETLINYVPIGPRSLNEICKC